MKKKSFLYFLGFIALLVLISPTITALAAEHESSGYNSDQWKGFLFRVMNFVVFVGLLVFLLRKPVAGFFNGRKENISRSLKYLETQAKNLEEQNQVLHRQISELAGERKNILAQYEKDGAKERDRIISEAEKTAQSIILKTEVAMEQEIKKARRLLAQEVGSLATSLAEGILIKNINDEDRIHLLHDFMEQVTRLPARN
jgi:F-type H+-transporting ATPase subunit b